MAPRVLDETRVRNLWAPEEVAAARAHGRGGGVSWQQGEVAPPSRQTGRARQLLSSGELGRGRLNVSRETFNRG